MTTQMVNDTPYVPKLYASRGLDFSKCIEGENKKLPTLLNYIYM